MVCEEAKSPNTQEMQRLSCTRLRGVAFASLSRADLFDHSLEDFWSWDESIMAA